jgi:hypothetical protein
MSDIRGAVMAVFAAVVWAGAVAAQDAGEDEFRMDEYLTPEEKTAREVERRKAAPPALHVEPAAVSVAVGPDGRSSATIVLRNTGGGALEWTARAEVEWLEVVPADGRIGYEEEERLTLRATDAALEPGSHAASVVIDAGGAAGSPSTVHLSVEVPKPEVEPEPPAEGLAADPTGVESLEPPAPVDAGPAGGAERELRDPALTLRAGVLMPSTGELSEYAASFLVALSYALRPGDETARVSYEFLLGFGALEESDGYESQPTIGDASVLLALGRAHASTRGYLLAGLGALVESVEELPTGDRFTNYAGSVALGGGLRFRETSLDARLTYSLLFDSANVASRACISIGYGF